MKIEILYFEGCPNHLPAAARVRAILQQDGIQAEVAEVEIATEQAAREAAFPGSPTIRVNGIDIEPAARNRQSAGLACRCYPGGIPDEEMIRAAIREAQ